MEPESENSTEFEYIYRDASNYKWFGTAVLSGPLRIEDLEKYLIDGEFFIPELVGMKCLTPEVRNEDDHDWHGIVSLKPTSVSADFVSAAELTARFKAQHRKGWRYNHKGWRYA